jgi:8-oxo-dGTP pyrophosphatase MutT (NUDIX family)
MRCAPKSTMRSRATETRVLAGLVEGGREIDVERLRSVLYPSPLRSVFVVEDGVGDEQLTPASVLFPIVLRAGGPSVLLTQRTETLRDHPGQISFPGGRVEPEDRTPADTALREAAEEIGLSAEHIEIIGYLPEYRTGTGFRVMPVVALVTPPFVLRPDPGEVAEVFEVPFAFLMDAANHQQHAMHYRGKLRHYVAMPFGEYFIWGATAGIIATLAQALAG